MKFKQFYLGCLAHASYYIGSEGEAAIVDPQRDVEQYLTEAETNNQKIKYIIETHLHADFVSGHIELARKTGAKIVFGAEANAEFEHTAVKDGDVLAVGEVNLRILETPGHTPEGISIIVENVNKPRKILTGDTLFIGDVGRPDLVGSKGFTAEQMAGFLYDSLHEKILQLPDDTEVYPAHGAGSLCGKNMSKETWSTVGEQRKLNYALQPMAKDEFVKMMTENLTEAPAYFPKSMAKNLAGARSLEELSKPKEMSAQEVKDFSGVILDVRSADDFGAGHIPNALNIGLGGQFASWAGTLIDTDAPVVIVADAEEKVVEAAMRLARVGIESVEGFLLISDWTYSSARIEQISVEEMNKRLSGKNDLQFIDVRRAGEYESGHAPRTVNLTLSNLENLTDKLDASRPTYAICQGGYRSSAATSILEQKGFRAICNITGGTDAWTKAGLEVEK
ncbi:MAG: MBL fold metallo-hydrolase [Acidobacteria bacterium]|jgi:glyoxylase-like metal-dependent hydrolase (beta-lactamase superfamily II)/rhodanese-related sulfurtransferase|nr:MBL fold metallo-hydrolase [Acidobacteriota bacterium]